MEETVIVIMLKDKVTGFLDKELGAYTIEENEDMIYNTYAVKNKDDGYTIFMRLTCDRDVSDWEFNAIYDYYDTNPLTSLVNAVDEDTEQYNPTWLVTFDFLDNIEEMEEKINKILSVHKEELLSVYDAIADKKDDYIDKKD